MSVNVIAGRINSVLLELGMDRITGRRINEWLVSDGYLTIEPGSGKNFKVPTDLGAELGVICDERVIRGENVKISLYQPEAQKYIVSRAATELKRAPPTRSQDSELKC